MNIFKALSRRLSTQDGLLFVNFVIVGLCTFGCVQNVDKWEAFGEQVEVEKVENTAAITEALTSGDTLAVKFEGEIAEVCQMKGCWMTLKSETGERVRVTFKDYGFFVPKGAAGQRVIVKGVATLAQLDEATAQHYADDAGREFDAEKDLKEISIVASGVLISKDQSSDQL